MTLKLFQEEVILFGLQRSGTAALKFLRQQEASTTVISRGDPSLWCQSNDLKNSICFNEDDFLNDLSSKKNYKLLILSPGISRDHPIVRWAVMHRIKIWSEIELASYFCRGQIIALTGTNGKTTTATLISALVRGQKEEVFLGGNIGVPFCEFVLEVKETSFVILELSSFQLESIENLHPMISIILNLSWSHMERYSSQELYFKMKRKIYQNLTSKDILIAPHHVVDGRNFPFDVKIIPELSSIEKDPLLLEYSLQNFPLIGKHNLINLWVAMTVARILEKKRIERALISFKVLDHRLYKLTHTHKYLIFDDSKSTNSASTIAAIETLHALKRGVLYVILGGKKRSSKEVISEELIVQLKSKVEKIFLIGETTDALQKILLGSRACYRLENALELIILENSFKGILLFSPAFPSFDQYENYQERGEHFQQLITEKKGDDV